MSVLSYISGQTGRQHRVTTKDRDRLRHINRLRHANISYNKFLDSQLKSRPFGGPWEVLKHPIATDFIFDLSKLNLNYVYVYMIENFFFMTHHLHNIFLTSKVV